MLMFDVADKINVKIIAKKMYGKKNKVKDLSYYRDLV